MLPVIVISQLFCTSLWFAGNGIINELTHSFNLPGSAFGYLISSVQLGFILGTLTFALLSIADRFSPSKVFFICALLGASFNLSITWEENTFTSILLFRFLTGFFLAGIYPVGMKIAADYYEKGLGKSLGFLVGALVIGTALPHLLQDLKGDYPWQAVLQTTSILAALGGTLMLELVKDGPFRKANKKLDLTAISKIFKVQPFKTAAFGYFGHMWELYAFWAFVPVLLHYYTSTHPETLFNIPVLSFIIIGIGGLACVVSGLIAQKIGTQKVAFYSLLFSCLCCLTVPFLFLTNSPIIFIAFLMLWGITVVTDSPLLSTLVAQNAPSKLKGTALTIVNCIGFSITIISIQLLDYLREIVDAPIMFIVLAFGPIFGLISLKKNLF